MNIHEESPISQSADIVIKEKKRLLQNLRREQRGNRFRYQESISEISEKMAS